MVSEMSCIVLNIKTLGFKKPAKDHYLKLYKNEPTLYSFK